LDKLQLIAQDIEDIMEKVSGVTDLSIEQQIKVPEVHVEIDRKKAKQYGVMVGEVSSDIETALAGEKIADIIEDDRFYDLVLRIDDRHKSSLNDIGSIPVETVNGYIVPLKAVAEIVDTKGPNQISRENGKRRIVVQANIKDRDLVSVVDEVQTELNEHLSLPDGYFISFDGQFETQAKAKRDIMILGALSFILIFAGLYMNFHSVNLALQLFVIIPLSVMGAVVGVAITSKVVSLATIVGFITLTGIAIRNGILLLELYEAQGRRLSIKELISLTGDRLTPVMMTTITSILGFVPLIIGGNTAGKEILYPAAVVIATGLISSTILNLIITPVIYYMFGNKK
jgi:Cu/Ag efflux pump CusA